MAIVTTTVVAAMGIGAWLVARAWWRGVATVGVGLGLALSQWAAHRAQEVRNAATLVQSKKDALAAEWSAAKVEGAADLWRMAKEASGQRFVVGPVGFVGYTKGGVAERRGKFASSIFSKDDGGHEIIGRLQDSDSAKLNAFLAPDIAAPPPELLLVVETERTQGERTFVRVQHVSVPSSCIRVMGNEGEERCSP